MQQVRVMRRISCERHETPATGLHTLFFLVMSPSAQWPSPRFYAYARLPVSLHEPRVARSTRIPWQSCSRDIPQTVKRSSDGTQNGRQGGIADTQSISVVFVLVRECLPGVQFLREARLPPI